MRSGRYDLPVSLVPRCPVSEFGSFKGRLARHGLSLAPLSWVPPCGPRWSPTRQRCGTGAHVGCSRGCGSAEVKVSGQVPKQTFLVVYDYGQGGIWAFVWAESADDIHERFRDLEVVTTRPLWLEGDSLARIEQEMTFDIDDVTSDNWIALLLRPG